jgi:hypothetical protein
MVCREVGRPAEGRAEGGRQSVRTGIRLADRSDRAVFLWTRQCGRCPMRLQESRARSRTTGSALIWEIPVNTTPLSFRAHSAELLGLQGLVRIDLG